MRNGAFFNGLVIERFQLVRNTIQRAISVLPYIKSVAAIEDTSEVTRILPNSPIDVVVLGTSTSLQGSLSVTKYVKQLYPHVKVIAFTREVAPEVTQTLAKSGIDSILDETATEQDLKSAVEACSSGNSFHSRTVYEHIALSSRRVGLLTPCEVQVLALLMEGATNYLISQRMYITIKTVEAHITRIYRKLDVSSRSQAVLRAREMYPSLAG